MDQRLLTSNETGLTIHIPPLTGIAEILLGLAPFALLGFLFLWVLNLDTQRLTQVRFHKKRGLNFLGWFATGLAIPWAALLVVAIAMAAMVLWSFPTVFFADHNEDDHLTDLRWHALALVTLITAIGALVASPLAIIRVFTTERQTDTAEQGLITDRINKAVEGLGAEKTVKVHNSETGQSTEETKPNLEVRIGSIYALERIAQDSDRDHIRIMEILCAYIRENAPAREAKDHQWGEWKSLTSNATEEECIAYSEAFSRRFGNRTERGELSKWARELQRPRTDISAALEVIGRKTRKQISFEQTYRQRGSNVGYILDLRETNLQGADLSELILNNAILTKARLEGANLEKVNMSGADLSDANLQGTDFGEAHLQGAKLINAHLEVAELAEAHLQGAFLWLADLNGASLWNAHLEGTKFWLARLEGANIAEAHMSRHTELNAQSLRGAGLKAVNLTMWEIDLDLLTEAYGDGSVTLPEGWVAGEGKLDHWHPDVLDDETFQKNWRSYKPKSVTSP